MYVQAMRFVPISQHMNAILNLSTHSTSMKCNIERKQTRLGLLNFMLDILS